jgi:hypothetical protein
MISVTLYANRDAFPKTPGLSMNDKTKIRVVHGANERYFDNIAGKTVGQVAKALREIFNIPKEADALIGGEKVSEDRILEAGEALEFVKERGVKGGQGLYTEEDILELIGADGYEAMLRMGIKPTQHEAITREDLAKYYQCKEDPSLTPEKIAPIKVDRKKHMITVNEAECQIEPELADIVQCLLNAKGEPRPTKEINKQCGEIFGDRLDVLIKRKLKTHPSKVGDYLRSNWRGFWLVSDPNE